MKLALIPPNSALGSLGVDEYHLLLPQNAMSFNYAADYALTYRELRKQGHFLIMDNGACEGLEYDWGAITELAKMFQVNEVVLPDVLGDWQATKKAVQTVGTTPDDEFGYMAVVQGVDYDENIDSINWYLEASLEVGIQTIGLPRHLLTTVGECREYRAILAEYIRGQDNHINIHLLGTNPEYIDELRVCGHRFRLSNVRGVDTSAPFNYACREGMRGQFKKVPACWVGESNQVRERPKDYFDMVWDDFDQRTLYQNVDTMARWVHG